jgi:hypothetical protein
MTIATILLGVEKQSETNRKGPKGRARKSNLEKQLEIDYT